MAGQKRDENRIDPGPTPQKIKTAKVLFAAFLAWMTLSFTLKHMIGKMDGADHEPSLIERIVFSRRSELKTGGHVVI